MIATGIVLFLAVIPLEFIKGIYRAPAYASRHSPTWPGFIAVVMFFMLSVTSLACSLAGPILFCLGLWGLILGG